MHKRILFLDTTAPKPYDFNTLRDCPQGGTESTVTRIAEGLAARGHQVSVGQLVTTGLKVRPGSAQYTSLDGAIAGEPRPDTVVCLRSPKLVPLAKSKFPDAKVYLWLHDFNQNEVAANYHLLKGTNTKIVCVSRTHRTLVNSAVLTQVGVPEGLTSTFIYNPIDDELAPDATLVDTHKLIFFSSPHKGVDHAVRLFKRLRELDPSYTLRIANPGYLPDGQYSDTGILGLGSLSHGDVIKEVRSALAVFHPNWVFPETFGLVHAEAMAVGTPVLTTALGANREIIDNPEFILTSREPEDWIRRVQKWSAERPVTKGREEFRLSNVLNEWERMLK